MASFPDFLNQKAPENYVAGVGRGATSFVTRSDLGPTHVGPTDEQMKAAIAKRAQQIQSKAEGEGKEGGGDNEGEGRYQDPDNEVGLFAGGIYEKDDEEADQIWQEVDERMARRRQKQRYVMSAGVRFPSFLWAFPVAIGVYIVVFGPDERITDSFFLSLSSTL